MTSMAAAMASTTAVMVAMIIMDSMAAVAASMAAILVVLILTPGLMVDGVSGQR